LSPSSFMLWCEIEPGRYCSVPPQERQASQPRQLIDNRLQEIAARLRRLAAEARAQAAKPAFELAADLAELAGLAEGAE
jgi:hypothetical protein